MAVDKSTAFVSYCREDEKFALRLAEDLKAAGAPVWIDQIDIPPGANWDESITDALTDCTHVLVILSPVSVESGQVLNEIGVALEKKKRVIPLLYRDCEIPLLIHRLHQIDLRTDYGRGVKRLLRALGITEPVQAPQEGCQKAELIVERIKDFGSAKERINEALTVLEKRLPPDELYDRESLVDLARDHLPNKCDSSFEMHFLVATYGTRCLGMLMGWDDVKANFCFISYMAASEWRSRAPADVSKQLANEVLKALSPGASGTAPRFIFEIDDPATAETKEQCRRRLSRLRLFHDLAPFGSVHLRVLDIPYLQPSLEWPPSSPEKQLLLCYAAPGLHTWVPKIEAIEILTWVYTQLYEGRVFSDLAVRAAFQAHNRELLDSVVLRLPERVGLLKYRDIEKRCVKA